MDKHDRLFLLLLGGTLFILEGIKQCYLYFYCFSQHYDVWYFPFQLCSLPMYLCILQYFLPKRQEIWQERILVFLQDFALMGGIAALLVPDGFLFPAHPYLSFHGYLWHILLIVIAIKAFFIRKKQRAQKLQDFTKSLWIFLPAAGIAELINIALHPFGDCDMFYISPYHPSVQPVFSAIDCLIGRPAGILLYLLTLLLGAMLIHALLNRISSK